MSAEKQTQAGRQTQRPQVRCSECDFFAEDVRRVLRRCKAPSKWGDQQALFLYAFVADPAALMRDANTPQSTTDRILDRLFFEADGRFFSILASLETAIKKRISRKEQAPKSWIIAMIQIGFMNTATGPISKEFFWSEKAESVAWTFGELMGQQYNTKDVENARSLIKEIKPYNIPPDSKLPPAILRKLSCNPAPLNRTQLLRMAAVMMRASTGRAGNS